jgi:multidrug efflux system outer membrane protein
MALATSTAAKTPAPRPPTANGFQVDASWSPDLGDPVLADLLRRAALDSLDLRMALARVERAGADVELARAARRPHLTIGAEAAVGGGSFSSTATGAGAPLLGSYEVDIFARLKQGQRGAEADKAAVQAEAIEARELVIAEVAKTYVALRAAQAHQAVAQERVRLADKAGAWKQLRHGEGELIAADMTEASVQSARVRAEAQAANHVVEAQCNRLGLLLGQDAPIVAPAYAGDEIPRTPDAPAVSSEAVMARPDVQAAEARLRAADARRAEAVAASRPRFLLTAGIGSGETDLLYLLDVRALAWAIAGGLTHELLDGGAAKARRHGARAEADLAELAYRKTVAQAWVQTRLSLATLQDAKATESVAGKTWRQAVLAFGTGQQRHADGDIDGPALDMLEGRAIDADTALADAQATRAKAFIDLSLALAGTTP